MVYILRNFYMYESEYINATWLIKLLHLPRFVLYKLMIQQTKGTGEMAGILVAGAGCVCV